MDEEENKAECPRCHEGMSDADAAICWSLSCFEFRKWALEHHGDPHGDDW